MCPFRVVDEINQGMDQINERKIFIQMVQAACRAGTPQCFMFTPKLLPDLPYSPDVTPMLIFNGVHSAELAAGFKDVRHCPFALQASPTLCTQSKAGATRNYC